MILSSIFMECGLKSNFREFKRMGAEKMETTTTENFCGIFLQKEAEKWGTTKGSGVKRRF